MERYRPGRSSSSARSRTAASRSRATCSCSADSSTSYSSRWARWSGLPARPTHPPRRRAHDEPQGELMDAAAVAGDGTDAKRLLVVEDQRIICRDICKTLEELGYVVCATARSSDEALEQSAAHHPDLVLMDIRIIGQVDGVEVATELKRRHQVPVVFLTGNTDEETLQRAFRAEPDGYLSKPFTRATLRSAIEVAMQRHGVEGRLRRMNQELAEQKGQLEKRADELALLSEMGDYLQLCDSADEVLAIVARFGRQLFPDDSGA